MLHWPGHLFVPWANVFQQDPQLVSSKHDAVSQISIFQML